MLLRLQIIGVADSLSSNSNIGLLLGSLKFSSAYFAPDWYLGFFDNKCVSGTTRSASNITTGGTLSTGYTGDVTFKLFSAMLVTAARNGDIQLNGKQAIMEVSINGTDWFPKVNDRISAVSLVDERLLSVSVDTQTALDSTKIPGVIVTEEMALNNPSSEAIGSFIPAVIGSNVFVPMIYCPPSSETYGAAVTDKGYASDTASAVVCNVEAQPVGQSLELYSVATPDLSYMKGKSLLQCVGAWQSSETSPVHVCLSFNGKQALFTDQTVVEDVSRAVVGKKLSIVRGSGAGSTYTVTGVSWANRELEWSNTNVESIWFELDTDDISDFVYSLPNWSATSFDNGNQPLYVANVHGAIAAVNAFVGPRRDYSFIENVSYLSFQLQQSGLFLIPNSVDLATSSVYRNVDGSMQYVMPLSGATVIYTADKWKLIALDMEQDFEGDDSYFSQTVEVGLTPYIYENTESVGFGNYLNSVGERGSGGSLVYTDNFTSQLTPITAEVVKTVAGLSTDALECNLVNTFYIPYNGVDIGESLLTAVPSMRWEWTVYDNYTGKFTWANPCVTLHVIGEGNISIGNAKFGELGYSNQLVKYYGTSSSPETMFFEINPVDKAVYVSSSCRTHDNTSYSLYAAIEKALRIKVAENTRQINGFLLTVSLTVASYNLDVSSITKRVRKPKIFVAEKSPKKDLYVQATPSGLVSASCPIGLIRQLCETYSIPYDASSFNAVENQQRSYFTTPTGEYSGYYSPSADESLTSVINKIAEWSMTALVRNYAGELVAKFLPEQPSTVSKIFGSDDVKSKTLSYSMPKSGYVYSDFDFVFSVGPSLEEKLVVDTDGATSFPAEEDFEMGAFIFNASSGFTTTVINYFESGVAKVVTLLLRSDSDTLHTLFTPGTRWLFTRTLVDKQYTYDLRLDTTAPDFAAPSGQKGIRLGFTINSQEVQDV